MQENFPKFTIILPTFNCRDTVERTIISIISQTYINIELIIIDGNSSDGTVDIIRKYEEKISSWISEPDNGIYDAMNKGISYSSGDWVYFLGAGDFFIDNNVLTNIAPLIAKRQHSIYYGRILMENTTLHYKILVGDKNASLKLKRGKMIPHQSVFVKRDVFKSIGKFNPVYRISADYDFLCRAEINGYSFKFVNLVIARYDVEGISNNRQLLLKEYRKIIFNSYGYKWFFIFFAFNIIRETVRQFLFKTQLIRYWYYLRNRLAF